VRAGWVLIVAGVLSAVIFQHADSVVFGALMVLIGLWVLTIKEVSR
jgi:putative Ca2+/H+ antiporter (TMEM165/GDT1 family)